MVLSHLRKLDTVADEKVAAMPIAYDIETDHLYKKGLKRG